MAKRSYRGKPKKSKGASPDNLMSQVQEMQEQMAAQQEALADETVSVTAGGVWLKRFAITACAVAPMNGGSPTRSS